MNFYILLTLLLSLITVSYGFDWNPNTEDYQWRACTSYEASKKNCPRGEPCLADTSYRGYVPNYALKCLTTQDFVIRREGSFY